MWIPKNSKNLLSSLAHLGVCKATSVQTFDFLPYTLPPQMIYLSLIRTTSYTMPLDIKMELHDIPHHS